MERPSHTAGAAPAARVNGVGLVEDPPEELAIRAGSHEAQLIRDRRAKLSELRAEGIDPYPRAFPDRTEIAAILADHRALDEVGEHPQHRYRIGGRLMARREHGKATFIDVADRSGCLQVYARRDDLGDNAYARLRALDVGDLVGIDGCVYLTRRRELALKVGEIGLLSKALRPPPEKHHGIADPETRARRRELDLIANAESRQVFLARSRVIAAIRRFFDERGFVEVETPVMQPLYGGALARPFRTHHNALDQQLFLRISTELYLKRCLVGGLENVYELAKCFRNEGISHHHNPEFTMLEWFQSYVDYREVIALIEELVAQIATATLGTTVLQRNGQSIDLAPPWRRIRFRDALLAETGIDVLEADRRDLAAAIGPDAEPEADWSQLAGKLFSKRVEPGIVEPTFVLDYPAGLCTVARRVVGEDRLVEAFDAVIAGLEVASGSTDLNDPQEQRLRFLDQRDGRTDERDDGQPCDDDFVRALEHGMPPAAGAGLGVDRLVMLLTDRRSLRDVVLFPTMRPAG
jgi:lysyl-tRNA synthetase class 2